MSDMNTPTRKPSLEVAPRPLDKQPTKTTTPLGIARSFATPD